MGWHYAARRTTDEFEGDCYDLVEVYPDLNSRIADAAGIEFDGQPAYTQEPVTITGSSREDLAHWLIQAAQDVLRHEVSEGEGELVQVDTELLK